MNISRLLQYETTALERASHPDYGQITQVITDKLINVNMSGSDYTLEAVGLESGYVPKVGDWVVVSWTNGSPIAKGTSSSGYGLTDVNVPTIVSTNDLANGTINSDHIRTNTIEARHIQAGSVTADAISANSITAQAIQANAVQTQHISANSISGGQIMAGTITTINIKSGSITSDLISANSINATMIQANSILSYMISANQIQTQHISSNSIMANQIGANQINATHISANSISAPMIQANAITTSAISANTIQSNQIKSNAIQTQHISANTIQTAMIQSGAITTSLISANSINASLLQANSVTAQAISANSVQTQHISANTIQTAMIQAGAITTSLISANSINAQLLQANSVTAQAISSNAVQTQHISANTIQTNQIKAGAITTSLISANSIVSSLIQAGAINSTHITSNAILSNMISANQILSQHISSNQINSTHIISNAILSNMISANQILANHISSNQVNANHISANSVTSIAISANSVQTQHISANSVQANQISSNAVQTQHISSNTIVGYQIKANQISANHIVANSITAQQMQVGTITAQSGILASGSIGTANIQDGIITSAKIGNGEIKTANIASGNITNAQIANATIDHSKIASVDAGTITVGQLNGGIIQAGTISGNQIAAQSITGDRMVAGTIDTTQLKAGSIITSTIASGAITTDKIEAGAVTGTIIRAGSITAEHISTVGLDAQLIQVYNSQTGETLVGSGYLRVDGLDVGVVQSDNLVQNGLFLTSSSDYGFKRMNPSGEALLGNTVTGVGAHQVWKIDLTSGSVVKKIDIPSKKPFDIAIHPSGNYAYITVQGNNTLAQLDLSQDMLVSSGNKNMGVGPARAKFVGDILEDHKHVFVLNTDPTDMNIPDTLMVIDTPPNSVNGDLYVHHEIIIGNNPYDFIVDANDFTYITMANEGDIVMVDTSTHDSHFWKVKGRIPISAYGTDNYHGDMPSTMGLQEVTGGDASGQYNDNMSGSMTGTMSSSEGSYGASDGSLRTYEPHGIVQSSEPNTLYVVDYANGELVVVDKNGNGPYNALVGTTAQGSYQGSNVSSSSSPASLGSSEDMGGGPGTYYVRYRIPVGDSPDFITLVNGKLFVSLQGSGDIAVVDEQQILNEISSDNSYYGTKNVDGSYTNWNVFQPMRTVNSFTVRTIYNVGNEPSLMKSLGNNLYVSVSNQGQVAVVDTVGEKVTKYIDVGTNPRGFDFTPDGKYMYVANYGGIGDLSFIYPTGTYIGDPFMALEGGIMYQGADGWTPDRSNWVFDSSGNIQSKATVEFHINEPLLNEGGYTKLTAYGIDTQYAQIEQDIINVTNYSNGNNTVNVSGGRLIGNGDNTSWTPREQTFISGTVHNVMIGSVVSGNTVYTSANSSQYSVSYSLNEVQFSSNAVASGNWVIANYTSPNNIYFKTHNSSAEIAVDNGSSPNFATSFQVDEFVPNFVVVDNRQTSSFSPTSDGISDTYEGLEYSVMTNRALNIPSGNITSNCGLANGNIIVDGDTSSSKFASGNPVSGGAYVKLDLGNNYMVGQINVWHYYSDGRTYHNTKTEVSEDGTNWTTVFDSAVSGEYVETSSGHIITFNALPVRYVRDWTNGSTSNTSNHWVEIQAMGDWQVEKGYTYPSNSTKAGQQIATNGIGFVSTDIPKAYVAMNVQINFTSWWWMTYVVGPQFGRIKIEMPTLMNSGHFLNQQASFVNNVAHRHIMTFPPSALIQQDMMNNIESGKHRVILRQDSGKVTFDRIRFEDYQYYNRSTLSIPSNTSATLFTRYKVVAEQAKWYQGQGRQSTEGAYDTPRTNPDTGVRDYSVPIKYRVRVLSQLSPTGNTQERGTVYITSAIFETGKQSTHWRRSESSDVFSSSRIEKWNPSQPHNTGIQSEHIANGAVRGAKILANAVMDYHISNYARIQEHKLELNYPTHDHSNKVFLDTMTGFAGTSGNYGTGNSVSRGDHNHDGVYMPLSGNVTVTGSTTFNNGITAKTESHFSNGAYYDPAVGQGFGIKASQGIATDKLNVGGNITVTGNIIITGTVDSVDVSTLNSSYITTSGNVTNHIGAGGSAHALVVSGGLAGFISGADKAKLDGIQSSAINQTTADGRYLQLAGGVLSSDLTINGQLVINQYNAGIQFKSSAFDNNGYQWWHGPNGSGDNVLLLVRNGTGNSNYTLKVNGTDTVWTSSTLGSDPATKTWVSGNYYNITTIDSKLVDATETTHGFLSTSDKIKLDGIQSSAINQTTTDARYLQLTGGAISGSLTITGNISITGNITSNGTYNGVNIVSLNSSYSTTSGNVTNHIGAGGNAHTIAVSGGSAGFIDGTNYAKLLNIQYNAINQSTTDSRYLQLTGGVLSGDLKASGRIYVLNGATDANGGIEIGRTDGTTSTPYVDFHTGSGNDYDARIIATGGLLSGNGYGTLNFIASNLQMNGIQIATQSWVTGNYYTQSYLNNVLVDATETTHGFLSTSDKIKLDGIQSSAINQSTADNRYLQLTGGVLSGSLSVTGNISITGTVDGVDVSNLNNSYSQTSANVTNHIGYGGSAHAVAISGGANGFIDGSNYGKLLRIQDNAINQSTADGRYYIMNQSIVNTIDNALIGIDTGYVRLAFYKKSGYGPSIAVASGNPFTLYEMNTSDLSSNISGTSIRNTLLNINTANMQYMGNNVWHGGNLSDPSTKTWISGNYYNQGTVDQKVSSRGDVFQANTNTFTNLNTFTNAGMGIKIQPSGSVPNTTKLMQINDTSAKELFSVNYSGGVNITGDLTVTGQTKYAGTTQVNGDYHISGNLYVSGNSMLGNVATDTTTVNGTLVVSGNIQEIGNYQEVHRRPLFGIAGDLQFQTNDTTYDSIVFNYDPTSYGIPAVQNGATRYYRLYVIYSDDINGTQASGGQQTTLMYSANGSMNWNLPITWGNPTGRRDWYTPYFTGLPTGHSTMYASLAQSGNNLGVRWIELIAYDRF